MAFAVVDQMNRTYNFIFERQYLTYYVGLEQNSERLFHLRDDFASGTNMQVHQRYVFVKTYFREFTVGASNLRKTQIIF